MILILFVKEAIKKKDSEFLQMFKNIVPLDVKNQVLDQLTEQERESYDFRTFELKLNLKRSFDEMNQ